MWQGLYKPSPSCGGQRNHLETSHSYGCIFVCVSVSPILLRYLINTLRSLGLRLGALTLGQVSTTGIVEILSLSGGSKPIGTGNPHILLAY